MHYTDILVILNTLVKEDSLAIQNLVGLRVGVNQDIADHPTIPVQLTEGTCEYKLGLLSVINGILKVNHPELTLYARYNNGILTEFIIE